MRVIKQSAEILQITAPDGVDPVMVIFQDCGPGKGKVIIECYSTAWACYWGAIGGITIREFFLGAAAHDPEYLASKMISNEHRRGVRNVAYLTKIIRAVCLALNGDAKP